MKILFIIKKKSCCPQCVHPREWGNKNCVGDKGIEAKGNGHEKPHHEDHARQLLSLKQKEGGGNENNKLHSTEGQHELDECGYIQVVCFETINFIVAQRPFLVPGVRDYKIKKQQSTS